VRQHNIGVLALQGDVREHVAALADCGASGVPLRRPQELDGLDGVIVPGGESTTIGMLLETFGLLDPLRKAIADGLPAYGSCAGMVLLANEVLDGRPGQPLLGGLDVVVRRNAFGRQVESFEADLEWPGGPLHAVFIRAPWVESVGVGVEVLAECPARGGAEPGGRRRIVAVRQGRVLATAFHPELTGDRRVHELFVRMTQEG
jgi:5'-phosphate synthase pdxT subunit